MGEKEVKIGIKIKKKWRFLFKSKSIKKIRDYNYVEKYLHDNNQLIFHNIFGKQYPNDVVYLISMEDMKCGLFAQLFFAIELLTYAEEKGYKVILKLSDILYHDANSDENLYDKFYMQPDGMRSCDIGKVRNIKIAHWIQLGENGKYLSEYDTMTEEILKKASKIKNKYIRYNQKTEKQLENDVKQLGIDFSNTIGVHVRGGDYYENCKGHPIPILVSDYSEEIEKAISKGYKNIFFATDDDRLLKEFISIYGDRIKYYKDTNRCEDNNGVHNGLNAGSHLAYEAIRDMYTLSKCKVLISGLSKVSKMAKVEKYSRDESFDYYVELDKGINN